MQRRVFSVDACLVASRAQVHGMKICMGVEVLITCILKLDHFTYMERVPVTILLGAEVKFVDPTVISIDILCICSYVGNYSAVRYLFRQTYISATNYQFILSITLLGCINIHTFLL